MIKQESFTTFYKINGHEYKVTAPAMVDTTTGKTVSSFQVSEFKSFHKATAGCGDNEGQLSFLFQWYIKY